MCKHGKSSLGKPFLSVKRFVEIAIVLCSLFLVALPAAGISADQNQALRQVNASRVTAASEEGYTLDIYGNANEDNALNMRDVTYIKLIYFEERPETTLADANYDGKISLLDVVQTKLIILGRAGRITLIDSAESAVTLDMPIERLVAVGGSYGPEAVLALGAKDKLVAVADYAKMRAELELLLEDVPGVGSSTNPDVEAILALNPDMVQGYACFDLTTLREQLEYAGIPFVQFDFNKIENYLKEIKTIGIILDEEENAEELIEFEQEYLGIIEDIVEDLEEEQKPRVYLESYEEYQASGSGHSTSEAVIRCGGINIFDDIEGTQTIDAEEVVDRNPQVIIKAVSKRTLPESGYGEVDTGQIEGFREAIITRPAWDSTDAVKKGSVYILSTDARSIHGCIFDCYAARMLHPEPFEDIDPVDVHRDWFERFLGIEFKGVYAYPTHPVPWT
jgi:iron complex transport system substrate-binding protein